MAFLRNQLYAPHIIILCNGVVTLSWIHACRNWIAYRHFASVYMYTSHITLTSIPFQTQCLSLAVLIALVCKWEKLNCIYRGCCAAATNVVYSFLLSHAGCWGTKMSSSKECLIVHKACAIKCTSCICRSYSISSCLSCMTNKNVAIQINNCYILKLAVTLLLPLSKSCVIHEILHSSPSLKAECNSWSISATYILTKGHTLGSHH